MSYILEALKKSQLERELGRVPTLDTAGLFEEDKVEPGRGPWVPLALGLAAVALSIALYAVLRVPPAPQSATPESTRVQTPVPPAPVGIQMGKDPAGMGQTETGRMSHGDAAGRAAALGPQAQAAADSRILALPSGVSPPPGFGSASSVAGGYRIPDLPATPLVEPPPPKGSRLAPVGAPPETFGSGSAPNLGDARSEADLDAEIQRELERHLAEDMAAAAAAAPLLPDETPSDQVPTPVPADLIAEIESFKKQLKGGESKAPSPAKGASAIKAADPRSLRLTPDRQAALPAYSMPVHVYVEDKAQRFVLINGLKYREGDETREGLKVEQILPDGTVLSYQGNPFYVRR